MNWSAQQLEKLRELYPSRSTREVAALMQLPYGAVKAKCSALRLRKVEGWNRAAHSVHALTLEQREFIRDNYTKFTNIELAKKIGRSKSAVHAVKISYGLSKPKVCWKKGNISWNKGKKMPPGWGGKGVQTRFKKGHLPHNTKEDGTISIRNSKGRPYVWVRVALGKWKELHRIVWEKTVGPIPRAYNVQFKDGNSTNCEPSNLYIINRHKQMQQNTIHRFPPELASTIRLLAKYKRKLETYAKQD